MYIATDSVDLQNKYKNKENVIYNSSINNSWSINRSNIKSATFELLYKPQISTKIIINEYLRASNFFIEDAQTKYLNALLDKMSKKIRNTNGWVWIN